LSFNHGRGSSDPFVMVPVFAGPLSLLLRVVSLVKLDRITADVSKRSRSAAHFEVCCRGTTKSALGLTARTPVRQGSEALGMGKDSHHFDCMAIPVTNLLKGVVNLVVGQALDPAVTWHLETRRDIRKHRRELIATWRAMVTDVAGQLRDDESRGVRQEPFAALKKLEHHPAYPSFHAAWNRYQNSGPRKLKRTARTVLFRAGLRKPKLQASPEGIIVAGSSLPGRLHFEINQIGELEEWWGLP